MQGATSDVGMEPIYKSNYQGGKKKMAGNWIKGAIKHPGSFTKQAEAHKMTPAEFAEHVTSHEGDFSEKTVKRANLDKTLARMRAKKDGGG